MKLSGADVIPSRLKFNSNKVHNPYCDILELVISQDAFITYWVELATGKEGMEYYSGSNYVVNSCAPSHSRNYSSNIIPSKYRNVWNHLKEYYRKNYAK